MVARKKANPYVVGFVSRFVRRPAEVFDAFCVGMIKDGIRATKDPFDRIATKVPVVCPFIEMETQQGSEDLTGMSKIKIDDAPGSLGAQ
jgi:hypothetical protein